MDYKEKLSNMKKKKNSSKKTVAIVFGLVFMVSLGLLSYFSIYIKSKPSVITQIELKTSSISKKVIYPTLYSDKNITKNAVDTNPKFKNITFSDKDIFLANTISSIQKDIETKKDWVENGTWLWTPIQHITPEYTKKIISEAKKNNINVIYLSIDTFLDIYVLPEGVEKEEKQKTFDNVIKNFISEANKNNIEVDAEAGWRNWAQAGNTYKAFAVLDYAIKFNKANKEKFRGFQYDVEPYLLDEYKENKEFVLRNLLILIDQSISKLNKSDLEFSVVIPEFYDGTNDETPIFTYKGKSGHAFDHLISSLDRRAESKIIVMSYRNYSLGNDGSVDISANEIHIANKHRTKVIIAQETGDVEPSYITFHKTSKRYFNKQISVIEKAFSKEKGFGGIATHYINSFIEL